MCPHVRIDYRHLANTIEPSVYSGDTPYVNNYVDHLLSMDTPT